MFSILFSEQFDKSFSKLKGKDDKKQIWNKILQLENRAPIGKKLKNCSYWSMHVNRYRIIYELNGDEILIADILDRKKSYREV